jgi:hypothetical protein
MERFGGHPSLTLTALGHLARKDNLRPCRKRDLLIADLYLTKSAVQSPQCPTTNCMGLTPLITLVRSSQIGLIRFTKHLTSGNNQSIQPAFEYARFHFDFSTRI